MLGENLKYLRLKKGLSQDYVAKYLDKKSFTTIQKWESNISEPSLKDTRKLCRLFNVDIDTLINKSFLNKDGDVANLNSLIKIEDILSIATYMTYGGKELSDKEKKQIRNILKTILEE